MSLTEAVVREGPVPAPRIAKPATGGSRRAAVAEVLHEYAFTKGPLGLPKLVAKVLLLLPRRRVHRQWMTVLRGATTRRLLVVQPRIAFRHSSRYLFSGIAWRESAALLTAHYAFLNEALSADFFERVIGPAGAPLWQWQFGSHRFAIVLRGPASHREGDLNLCFVAGDAHVYTIAFSVVPGDAFDEAVVGGRGRHVIYIGHVQGMLGQFDAIRRATRLCDGIAPQDLLMSAMAGLAQAWGIRRILSPGPARHLSAQKMPTSAFDYAAFWTRYGGRLDASGHYVLDAPFPRKPIVQIVNRHRKRASKKRDFKHALTDIVAQSIESR